MMSELLERRAGLSLREELLPKQRRRNDANDPPSSEQIKRDHDRERGGEGKSPWREKLHSERAKTKEMTRRGVLSSSCGMPEGKTLGGKSALRIYRIGIHLDLTSKQ